MVRQGKERNGQPKGMNGILYFKFYYYSNFCGILIFFRYETSDEACSLNELVLFPEIQQFEFLAESYLIKILIYLWDFDWLDQEVSYVTEQVLCNVNLIFSSSLSDAIFADGGVNSFYSLLLAYHSKRKTERKKTKGKKLSNHPTNVKGNSSPKIRSRESCIRNHHQKKENDIKIRNLHSSSSSC